MGGCVVSTPGGPARSEAELDRILPVIEQDVINNKWVQPNYGDEFAAASDGNGSATSVEEFAAPPAVKSPTSLDLPPRESPLFRPMSSRSRTSMRTLVQGDGGDGDRADGWDRDRDKSAATTPTDGDSAKEVARESASSSRNDKENPQSSRASTRGTPRNMASPRARRDSEKGDKSAKDRPSATTPKANSKRDWTKGTLIGTGAMGRVYKGLDNKTGEFIAIKEVMVTNREILQSLKKEIELLKTISHDNIVKYLGLERDGQQCFILMEYVAGNTLAGMAKMYNKLKEPVACKYTAELLKVVEYIHSRDIVHRDIKGANILVTPTGTIKLVDFGSAKNLTIAADAGRGANALVTVTGTPFWMAPEVIQESGYGKPADIWSVGCTILEMMTGEPPYYGMGQVSALKAIACDSGTPPHKLDVDSVTPACYDLICQCLERNPKIRPGAATLLKHMWFNDTTANMKVTFKIRSGDKKKTPTPLRKRRRMSGDSSDGETLQLLGIKPTTLADGVPGSPTNRNTSPKLRSGRLSPKALGAMPSSHIFGNTKDTRYDRGAAGSPLHRAAQDKSEKAASDTCTAVESATFTSDSAASPRPTGSP